MSTNNKQQNYCEASITLYMNSFLCKRSNCFKKEEIEKALENIPHDHIFGYPDGTLQIFGECFKKSFESSSFVRDIRNEDFQFIQNYRTRGGEPVFSHWAGSLIPFMRYDITIWIWEHDPKLFRNLKGKIFFDPCVTTLKDNQCPLDNTTVHIVFKKTIRSKQIDSFIEVIKDWLSSEMNQTDNDRNKINLNNKGLIEFFQKITRFSMDITNADQNIITYLMLQFVRFSSSYPIEGVYFTQYYQAVNFLKNTYYPLHFCKRIYDYQVRNYGINSSPRDTPFLLVPFDVVWELTEQSIVKYV
jgi:hypothetical protein